MSVARRIAIPLVLVAALLPSASAQLDPADRDVYARGVVGLEITYQMWDEDRPWLKTAPKSRTAAAVVVEGPYLLTDAWVLDHATLIQLVTFGRLRSVEPKVVRIDRDVNMALLKVDDPAALEGLEPVSLAERTPTSGTLRTVRWKQQQLESAASRVSRFEVERGWGGHVRHAFLHMRTDLSGGGWGEPVFQDSTLVAITISQSKQISRAVPVELVRAFLERATAPGPYVGFPALGAMWQVNRDLAVTRFLGQEGEPRGILVRQVPWGTSGCGVLKPRDILLELDGVPIDAEGYYLHERLGRLRFHHHLVEHHRIGDSVPVKVLRDGRELELTMTLRGYPAALNLLPSLREGQPPYVIAGGLVLRELDAPYLRTWGDEWTENAPTSLLTRYYLGQEAQTPERRRIVLITSVLPSEYNVGYQNVRDQVVDRINGRSIGGIPDVIEALRSPVDGFHVFELAPDSVRGRIVLDAATFDPATAQILADYGVPEAVHLPDEPLPSGGGVCPGDY